MKGPHICSSDAYVGSDKIDWEENMERQGKQHWCTRVCMGAPTFQFPFIPFLQGLVLILIYGNILSWQEKFICCFPTVLVNIKLLLSQHCTSNERCLLSQGNLSEVGDQCLKRDQGHATWLLLPVTKKKIMWNKFGKKNTRLSQAYHPLAPMQNEILYYRRFAWEAVISMTYITWQRKFWWKSVPL